MKFVTRRLIAVGVTAVLVTVIAFMLIQLLPGDPAQVIAGDEATPVQVEHARKEFKLDRPLPAQYLQFVSNVVHGDLGRSVRVNPGANVTKLIGESVPITGSLLLISMGFTLIVALPIGTAAALRPNSFVDRSVTALSSMFMALPSFVLALVLVTQFAVNRSWLPAVGYVAPSDGLFEWLKHLILPGLTLGAVSAAELARQVRGALVDVLEQDYVRTAAAKGMARRTIILKHALKNAATPIITVASLQVARAIGGSVIVEQIFGLSGVGSLAYGAVIGRDIQLIQGIVLVSAATIIVVNFLADVSHGYLNPRTRTA